MGDVMLPGAVVPEDLSLTGIRGRWERPLPEGKEFRLRLHLHEPVLLRARVAWQRHLPSSGALAGLRFAQPAPRAVAALTQYMETLQTPSRRRSPRVANILPIDVLVPGTDEHFTPVATDLSVDGLCAVNDNPFPEEETLLVILCLGWGPPIEMPATVRWIRQSPWHGYSMGLQFVDPAPAAVEEIRAYLATGLQADTDPALPPSE